MDVDFEYMKAAVEYAAKHGYKATFKEFPKCKYPSTLERYKARVLHGSKDLSMVEVRNKLKKRIAEEIANGVKVDVEKAKEYFRQLEQNHKIPDRLKGSNGFINRCLREVRLDNGETVSDDEEELNLLDNLNDLLEATDREDKSDEAVVEQQPSNGNEVLLSAVDDTDVQIEPVSNCDSGTIDFSHIVDVHVGEQQPDSTTSAHQPLEIATTSSGTAAQQTLTFIPINVVPIPIIKFSKVLLLGDSLTQLSFSKNGSWASILADHFARVCDVINRGVAGYNSKWYKNYLTPVLSEWLPSSISCIVLSFGMNDAALPECPSRQYVPVKQYKTNLREMIQTIVAFGVPTERIIVIGPPPFCLRLFKSHRKDTRATKLQRSSSSVLTYCEACKKVSETCSVTYLDTMKIFKASERGERLLSDGLHLSPSGAQLLAQSLEPLITEKVKAFNSWDTIKQNFVPWNQFAKMTKKNENKKLKKM